MKRIIFDQLSRWWWLWFLILTGQFLIVGFSVGSPEGQKSMPMFFAQLSMFLGVFPLSINLAKGFARALLALPVTSRQIARTWWSVAVAIPALAITLTTLLAVVIFSYARNETVHQPEIYVLNCLLNALWLGAAFFLLTGLPTRQQTDWLSHIRGIFFGALWGLSFSGGIFLFRDFSWANPERAEIFMVVAAVASVAGWFRAERMVLERGGFRPGIVTTASKPGQFKAPAGGGGLPFLIRTTLQRTILFGFVIITVMALFSSFGVHNFSRIFSEITDSATRTQVITSMLTGISTPLIFVAIIQILPVAFQMRFLRTLPISPSILAATLVFLPVISIAVLCLLVGALASPVAGAAVILPVFKSFLMTATLSTVAILLVVSRGLDILTYFLIIFGCVVSSTLSIIFHGGNLPLWGGIAVAAAIMGITFALTQRMLTQSSHVYRVRPNLLNAWGGGWR